MEKIIVFGATGGTGNQIVIQALQRGYEVAAVVRNPAAFNLAHPQLTIIKGDVMQPGTFNKGLQGKTAVISCLGNGASLKPTTLYSQGMQNIIVTMRQANVTRLVCISAGALDATKEMGFFIRLLVKYVLQKIISAPYEDMCRMELILKEQAQQWTIMRPARLTNGKPREKYRMAINAHLRKPWKISKADLATAMLDSINNKETYKAIVEIAG